MKDSDEFDPENITVDRFIEWLRIMMVKQRDSKSILGVEPDTYEKIRRVLERYENEIQTAFTKSVNISDIKTQLREYLLLFDRIRENIEEFVNHRVEKILEIVNEDYEDLSVLTPEERILYEDIRNAISKFKEIVYPECMRSSKIEISTPIQTRIEEPHAPRDSLLEESDKRDIVESDERNVILYMLGNFPRTIATHKRNHKLRKEDVIIISEMYAKIIEEMGFGKKYEIS